jgi:arabinose-5-phosphate isomerase
MDIIEEAKKVLEIEYKAIKDLIDRIGDDFVKAIELLDQCKGRVIITGMGKSGLIGKKISATLASTGTPSFFLHPAEATHGDLGIVTPDDVIIAISNSGNSSEIIELLPFFKRFGIKVIAFTGNRNSPLAQSSDICLDISVETEACPFNMVPTTSTTATLSMGDALAVALLKKKNFKEEDFAVLHPGGSLGKSLLLRVRDLMHTGDSHPSVKHDVPLKTAICEMTSKGLGMTVVVDDQGFLDGLITDGDLRRILETKKIYWNSRSRRS